jgi:hypothetical protein
VKDLKNTQEIAANLNYDYYPWKHWSVFGFTTFLNNPFRDLRIRATAAAGGKWMPLVGERGSAALSLALLREYNQFRDRTERREFRYSWRAKGELKFGTGARLAQVTFLILDLETPFRDYRVDSDTDISAPVNSWLNVKTAYVLNYERRPRPGVETTDRRVTASLVAAWK